MQINLSIGLFFFMVFVTMYSLYELKRGEALNAIYTLLIFIATALFLIAVKLLLKQVIL